MKEEKSQRKAECIKYTIIPPWLYLVPQVRGNQLGGLAIDVVEISLLKDLSIRGDAPPTKRMSYGKVVVNIRQVHRITIFSDAVFWKHQQQYWCMLCVVFRGV